MDVDEALSAILEAIADRGPASLESLLDRLPLVRPGHVARAFQAARADGLIEAIPSRLSRGEPVYRLTYAGRDAMPTGELAARDEAQVPRRIAMARGPVGVDAVLGVVAEFTEASIGLVAWELCTREDEVLGAWRQAFAEGWLEHGAYDAVHDEQMARLTVRGTERLTVLDEMTG
jgi:hypothetical protein